MKPAWIWLFLFTSHAGYLTEVKTIPKIETPVEEVLNDYKLVNASRQASILGRKEVFMGKAKFGIFGDGKEVAQIAMAKVFKKGDFRAGYYRDQTFMLAIEELTLKAYYAQLYAHTDIEAEPASGGRLMNGHFANRLLDDKGKWKKHINLKNSTADVSCTAAQMPRLVGLGLASKLYRENKLLHQLEEFSRQGREIAFGTTGNASTSEGLFFEAVNAISVMQLPVILSVWDDDYGISVPQEYHTTKESISKAMKGFQRTNDEAGWEIMVVKGWDYPGLVKAYKKAEGIAREEHVPVMIHVTEMTQPLGHSTSGSHERYKSKERLAWEDQFDCIGKMREWILENDLVDPNTLDDIEEEARNEAKREKNAAWKDVTDDIKKDQQKAIELLEALLVESDYTDDIRDIIEHLEQTLNPVRLDTIVAVKRALRVVRDEKSEERNALNEWLSRAMVENDRRYSSHLYSESSESALKVKPVAPVYSKKSKLVDGREVLQACFDAALARDPRVFAFGEDVGKIGDVNQGFAGLQEKHGESRVFDTGIRESTIVGQGIGAAIRGLRPIAEIQYLDYLLFGLQTLSDDLATLQYRTAGGQKAPVIIRTRGHRLEGVWHSGSPMGMIINSLRGIYILVPRDMTQAAGFYNTMLESDDPALIIESLNGYRLKERIPDNVGEFKVSLGMPEVLREGEDITIVTYGSMCRIVVEAARQLEEVGISCEVIDVQTLIPFDRNHMILDSVKKTNRVVFADEDVPGGAAAYMLNNVMEVQNAYFYLDSQPITITSKDHRPAYGSDGDYFSKPNAEEIFDRVYAVMAEADPQQYPDIY